MTTPNSSVDAQIAAYVDHLNTSPRTTLAGEVLERRYKALPGKKYTRIAQYDADADGNPVGGEFRYSAYCFIENETGLVFKSDGWKRPAKGARYSLLDEESRATLYARSSFSGGEFYR